MNRIVLLIIGLFGCPMLMRGQEKTLVTYQLSCADTVNAGDSLRVSVTIHIEPGWYVYAPVNINKMQNMQLTQVQFGLLPPEFQRSGTVLVPEVKQKGSFAVYQGRNHTFIQTFAISKQAQSGSVMLRGKLTYQACNDRICAPPITEKFEKSIRLIGIDAVGVKESNSSVVPTQEGVAAVAAWTVLEKATLMFASEEQYQAYEHLAPLAMKRFEDKFALNKIQLAASFLNNFPSDSMYSQAMKIYLSADPYFIADSGNEALDSLERKPGMAWRAFMRSLAIDTIERNKWLREGEQMVMKVYHSNIPHEDKEAAAFLWFARDYRLAARHYTLLPRNTAEQSYWLTMEQLYWQPFFLRFQKHMETYSELPILSDRAKDFLASLKSQAPSAAARFWKEIQMMTAISKDSSKGLAALHATANEQLQALVREHGKEPLNMKFTTLTNTEFRLDALRGKVVLIDFWATWCKPCLAELPHLKEMYNKYHQQGFEIAGICLDNNSALPRVKEILQKNQVQWPQRFEGKGFSEDSYRLLYGINALPTIWLLDKSGKIISTDARGPKLESLIRDQLN
jgi:thiol-disulfide isomerase/thioredoxin